LLDSSTIAEKLNYRWKVVCQQNTMRFVMCSKVLNIGFAALVGTS
jgi:hypothetical protein